MASVIEQDYDERRPAASRQRIRRVPRRIQRAETDKAWGAAAEHAGMRWNSGGIATPQPDNIRLLFAGTCAGRSTSGTSSTRATGAAHEFEQFFFHGFVSHRFAPALGRGIGRGTRRCIARCAGRRIS